MARPISAFPVDVAIVGAGPAGLCAATLLARDFSVLVADPRPIGGPKPCAGLLSEEARAILASLGEGGDFFDEPAELELRAFVLGQELPPRRFFNVERGRLQAWMASRAEARGAMLSRTALREATPASGGWSLVFDENARVRAEILIGADGVASRVRRTLGLGSVDVVAARQGFFEGRLDSALLVVERESDDTLYYCWAVPKRGGILAGAADPDGFPERALRILARRAGRFSSGRQIAEERGAYTRIECLEDVALGIPGAYLIGEAAGLVMPSSGEGLGGALESAVAIASLVREIGIDGARPGGAASPTVIERYRAVMGPRLDRIAADLGFLAALSPHA